MNPRMRAVVIEQPGPPEVLRLQDRPVPKPKTGWVLIRVRAFGLNRSELFTRQGHSPTVTFPRILGIEAVGEIVTAPGTELSPGQTVATATSTPVLSPSRSKRRFQVESTTSWSSSGRQRCSTPSRPPAAPVSSA